MLESTGTRPLSSTSVCFSTDDYSKKNTMAVDGISAGVKIPSSLSEKYEVKPISQSVSYASDFKHTSDELHVDQVQIAGQLPVFRTTHFTVLFETHPWWIFALDKNFVSTVFIPQFGSLKDFLRHCDDVHWETLLLHAIQLLGKEKFMFGNYDTKSFFLISGPFEIFATSPFLVTLPITYIYVFDSFHKLRHLPKIVCPLFRLKHKHCGGATDMELIWGSSFSSKGLSRSPLRRQLGHFLEYHLKTRPWTPACSRFLAHDRLLPVNHLHHPVRLPVHHFRSQFGLRALSSSELSSLFGLQHSYWAFMTVDMFPILPIQVLDMILRQFLPRSNSHKQQFLPLSVPSPVSDLLPVTFKGLPGHLPSDWHVVSTVQSQKATKADDAAVPTQLWDNRILALFPHATALLPPLRRFVLRYLQRKMYLEFRNFLRKVFPLELARYLSSRAQVYLSKFKDRLLGGVLFSDLTCQWHDSIVSVSTIKALDEIADKVQTKIDSPSSPSLKNQVHFTKGISTPNINSTVSKSCEDIPKVSLNSLNSFDDSESTTAVDEVIFDKSGTVKLHTENGLKNEKKRKLLDSSKFARNSNKKCLLKSLKKINSSKRSYVNTLQQFERMISAGRQCLFSYCNSSFFNWDCGSTLCFWRWHPHLREVAITGFQPAIISKLPTNQKRARTPSKEMKDKIFSKIAKSLTRGYLIPTEEGSINNVIDYFAVPKGEDDVRMVLNGSSCGLNQSVWAPNFWLPASASMLRALSYNYKVVDLDLGEMFLNFPLNPTLQKYSGMDLSPYYKEISEMFPTMKFKKNKRLIVQNTRTWMGFKPSPEWACRFYYFAEEFIRGDEKCKNNPLRWDRVVLNLIGASDYNPAMPNVMKWDDIAGRVAGDIRAYVDDLRAIGWSLEHAWQIARLIASRLQYLCIQDAARKRRVDNGPWAGGVYLTSESKIQKTVVEEKWNKGRNYILGLHDTLLKDENASLSYKHLERVRGYLCHLAMTYELLFPFLKGFHLTLCAHLPKRDTEGWKMSDLKWLGYIEECRESGKMSAVEIDEVMKKKFNNISPPTLIKPVPRFIKCLQALVKFFSLKSPPIITDRSTNIQFIAYGFADASGSGFGSSISYENGVRFRAGTWAPDTENESSNYREFRNVVETLEYESEKGNLDNCMLILATDNSTVESSIFKGNSTSEKLYDLIVRFRYLELSTGSKFLVTHVSGDRMKAQGTDGISRGCMREGVSLGQSMLSFCPWHLSALERSPALLPWLESTFGPDLEVLSPEDWYGRGHDHAGGYVDESGFYRLEIKSGTFLWHPPPAAADAAVEELRKARLKRRNSTHIVVVPRIMTPLWLKQLNKVADIILTVPCTHPFWPDSMFEPLKIAFLFPFSRHPPWQFRATPKLLYLSRTLPKMLQDINLDPRNLLQQFFVSTTRLSRVPSSVVWRVLHLKRKHQISYSSDGSSGRQKRVKFN